MRHLLDGPPRNSIYDRLAHPPAIFRQEKLKIDVRLPARRSVHRRAQAERDFRRRRARELGIVVQGGLYNGLMRALQLLGLADDFGGCRIPIYVLNVIYPLVPERNSFDFCKRQSARVLVLEEGQPEFIEQEIAMHLRRADLQTTLHGKDLLQMAGRLQHRGDGARAGALPRPAHAPHLDSAPGLRLAGFKSKRRRTRPRACWAPLPPRPPTFCVGCPERPVFSAMKLVAQDIGRPHVVDRRRLPCLRHLRAVLAGQSPCLATA